MQVIQIGSAKYISCGDQLYRYSPEAAGAALQADWARGILTENNVWLTPEQMLPEQATELRSLAESLLDQAAAVLSDHHCEVVSPSTAPIWSEGVAHLMIHRFQHRELRGHAGASESFYTSMCGTVIAEGIDSDTKHLDRNDCCKRCFA